jgi:hypothetical protein
VGGEFGFPIRSSHRTSRWHQGYLRNLAALFSLSSFPLNFIPSQNMATEPVYKQVSEAVVTYSLRVRALEDFFKLYPKQVELDHASAQLENAHAYLLDRELAQTSAQDDGQAPGPEPQVALQTSISVQELPKQNRDLADLCSNELSESWAAIEILTKVLEEMEGKTAKALLDLINGEGLSSEAVTLTLLRFKDKKIKCDARCDEVRNLYINLARMSVDTVKAEVTADGIKEKTGRVPTDDEIEIERQRALKTHPDRVRKALEDTDNEAANRTRLAEIIEQLEAIIEPERQFEIPIRQATRYDSFNFYDPDDEEAGNDDESESSYEYLASVDDASDSTEVVAIDDRANTQPGAGGQDHQDNHDASNASSSVPTIADLAIR